MLASAISPNEMVVSTTLGQHTTTSGHPGKRWWEGMTLDQQDEWLDRIDPEHYAPGQTLPMPVGRWNREKRRVRRARERWTQEIIALRTLCHCKTCRENARPPFPRYYVVNGISYECWLEEHAADPEIEEFLIPLRNDRPRAGAAFIRRISASQSQWNIPYQ